MRATVLLVFLAAVLALGAPAATRADRIQGCGAEECIGDTPVVPSLDPEWSASFVPPPLPRARAAVPCIATDVVAYTPTDWQRFAQKMRANMSSCASYYVSIPPVAIPPPVPDKTRPRGPNQAPLIRAQGPNFHAVNEVNVTAAGSWKDWVTGAPGRTWYDAGVEARRRMDDPAVGGFDVAAGDLWAVNELNSAVRQGTGTSRQNMRDFVHGLYDGAGGPKVKGIVWVSNFGQGTTFFDTYKGNLKAWLGDEAFWADMSQYVRFFSQEVYARVDRWAVPGTTPQERLVPTADYLEHLANLTAAGSYSTADPAAAYLASVDTPIGNAAWSAAAFEWPTPVVDPGLAAAFAAFQVYAFRHEQAPRPSQSFGFAWQPTNPALTPAELANSTAPILDRIAAAIHASDSPAAAATDVRDTPAALDADGASPLPGIEACGPDVSWCAGDLTGATLNTAWRIFHDWTQPSAKPGKAVVQEGTPATIQLTAVDPDPQPLAYSIVGAPSHGTATSDGTASATYVPETGYYGPDAFTFQVSDGWMTSTAIVTVTVNAPPVVDAGADVAAPWGVPVAFAGRASDPDGPATALTAAWSFGDGATASTLDVSHAYADPGTYTATLTVRDGAGGVASDSVVVTVGPRVSSLGLTTPSTLDRSASRVSASFGDVTDAGSARLAGRTVRFEAGGASCTAETTASGGAACTLPAASVALGPSTLTARFAGDELYAATTATGSVTAYALPAGGAFAVGDESAAGVVVFWSPSWWRANRLSGGSAPASFKGFATRGVDGGWVASPGFDDAPAAVPDWMGVLVANRVTKTGPSILVETEGTVVVHVESYGAFSTGEGTVVATVG